MLANDPAKRMHGKPLAFIGNPRRDKLSRRVIGLPQIFDTEKGERSQGDWQKPKLGVIRTPPV
jgi:hypothetical protein